MASCICGLMNRADGQSTIFGKQPDQQRFDFGGIHGHPESLGLGDGQLGNGEFEVGANNLAAQAPVTFTYSFSNLFDGNIDLQSGFSQNSTL